MRKTAAAGLTVGLIAALGFAMPASASTANAQLSVLHGIPDTPVDVWVNGALQLDDFAPGDLAGPLDLPAGTYAVAITAPDAADASAPILAADLPLTAGGNFTAVAYLSEAGEPSVKMFTNDNAATAAGEGRLTVRHVAAAPAVDVLAGGAAVVEGLANPNEATLNLPAGTVEATVALAGTTEPVLGPAPVEVKEGVLTIVYAWGSAADGNLAIAAQEVTGLHSSPDGVPSGSAGYLAQQDATTATFAIGGALALAVAAGALITVRRRASAQR
ncbi:DUF4397 domain-containing protein [Microbacterium lacus]|uniref:DUF4397 domain-containing protein n=1 Tax=Microbacterium lacus TaxID=415217 RepID=UPI0038500D5D